MGKGDGRSRRRKTGPRTPSGQPSRSKEAVKIRKDDYERVMFEEGPTQTVLQARRRRLKGVECIEKDRTPVTKAEAQRLKLDDRGSVLGNWLADGSLTGDQVRAGEDYCARYERYAMLNGLPKPTPKISSYGEVSGMSRPDRIEAARKAKAAHMREYRVLVHCSSGVRTAIHRACVLDMKAPLYQVIEGLNALKEIG